MEEIGNETFDKFESLTTDKQRYRFNALDQQTGLIDGTLREIGETLIERNKDRARQVGSVPWLEFDKHTGSWKESETYPFMDWVTWASKVEGRSVTHTVQNLFPVSGAYALDVRYLTVSDGEGVELEYAVEDSGRVLSIRLFGPRAVSTSGKDWSVLGFTSNQEAVLERRPVEVMDLEYSVDDLFDGLDPLGSVVIGSYPVMKLGTDVYTFTVPVRFVTPTPR